VQPVNILVYGADPINIMFSYFRNIDGQEFSGLSTKGDDLYNILARSSGPYRKIWTELANIVQPVNILVYGADPINIMFSSVFCPNSFFVLDIP
jgi:hypothetical protein